MLQVKKEKQFIFIHVDNGKCYKFDINNSTLYGLTGRPIQRLRGKICSTLIVKRREIKSNVLDIITHTPNFHTTDTTRSNFTDIWQGADRLDSVGVYLGSDIVRNLNYYAFINNNFIDFLDWYKEQEHEQVNLYYFYKFVTAKKFRKKYNIFDPNDGAVFALAELFERRNPTDLEKSLIIYYTLKQKVYEYDCNSTHQIDNYILWCRDLKIQPKKTNCFTKEYVEVQRLYEAHKAEINKQKFIDNYAKQSKAWDFKYGNYYVHIPQSQLELAQIGTIMHNCVGGYADSIIVGRKFVVFIKNKLCPNNFAFAVEVYNNGKVGQFLKPYNNRNKNDEELELFDAFSEHIENTWAEH